MSETHPTKSCPDCERQTDELAQELDRRRFLQASGGSVLAVAAFPSLPPMNLLADRPSGTPESVVTKLYQSMNETQRAAVCFDWDYVKTFSSGSTRRACCAPASKTTGRLPTRQFTAIFIPPINRR